MDAVDASLAIAAYARKATDKPLGLSEIQSNAADIDKDGYIDAIDASYILSYYAYTEPVGILYLRIIFKNNNMLLHCQFGSAVF